MGWSMTMRMAMGRTRRRTKVTERRATMTGRIVTSGRRRRDNHNN